MRGREVFQSDKKAACQKCHTLDAARKAIGPDLLSIGDKFEKRDLISSVLEPSRTIAVGYGVTIVATTSGFTHHGVLQRVTNTAIELRNIEGQIVRITADEIDEQRNSDVSIMPEGLETQMTQQEFADLIAFLGTLKQARGSGAIRPEVPDEIARCATPVQLVPYFTNSIKLDRPVWFGQVPGEQNRFVVLEHFGRIWLVQKEDSGDRQKLLLDLTQTVRGGGATGLLGMAFHPEFTSNRRYFLKYQITVQGKITTVIDERKWATDLESAALADPPKRLLSIVGTTQDHNGGCLTFGPDGYLYIGMGDSGPQEDTQGHGQDLQTLLGKILRIDVDRVDEGLAYGIPGDNPFHSDSKARREIWAYGFREPWRFSFDSVTGEMWVGDVGQNRFEEVAIVRGGENHGWNVYEGFADHSREFRSADARYVNPILAYPRRLGVSVTGGYVYRGDRAPQMRGRYIFGDFESRRIWALSQKNHQLEDVVEIGRAPTRIVSFAASPDGELFLVGYDTGTIYRLDLERTDLSKLSVRAIAETAETTPVLWRYSTNPPARDWTAPDFDDSSWKSGPAGFGTTGTPGGVIRTDWNSNNIWLRRKFDLAELPASLESLVLRIHHDEDAVIFINGVEAARLDRWTTGYVDVPINPVAAMALRIGENQLAIHCRQNGGGQFIDAGILEFVKPRP